MKPAWALSRLRTMSAEEVLARSRRRVMLEAWRRRTDWRAPRPIGPVVSRYQLPPLAGAPGAAEVLRPAEAQLSGRMALLGQEFQLQPACWHLDPQSGVTAPPEFGPLLDYRDPELVGNARNVWELNRHQHLVTAALAFALTGDRRYAAHVRAQIESWLRQNPFPHGINWNSPLELGLRLISWVWISRLLAPGEDWDALFGEHGEMWPSVYRHQWMIAKLQSVGSSANNHLIGEMAGQFIAASEWPFFDESLSWARQAHRMLDSEIVRQYYPSGLNREQAWGYHLFATELLVLAGLEGDRLGRPFGSDYREALRRAVTSAAGLAGPGSLRPAYGDCDDGIAVGLPGSSDVLERLRIVVSRWLGGGDAPADPSEEARLATRLLLSGISTVERRDEHSSPAQPDGGSRAFTDAGLFRMVSHDDGLQLTCLADAGDLGYLSIAAHGHADALSFTLSADDEQLLVDPGTYTYHFDAESRAYFRGTRAHNTITIDGQDQSRSAGPFLWTRKAQVTVRDWQPAEHGAGLSAIHDGYERLSDPVRHSRRFVLEGRRLTIEDVLEGRAVHGVEWRLHMAPHCSVEVNGRTCEILGRGHRLILQLDDALEWDLLTADPRGGWYSCCFNQRTPTTTLVGSGSLVLPTRLQHTVTVSR